MPIYLDHAATTPLDPQAREAMLPFLDEAFGNPSSIHAFGRVARTAVDDARDAVARLIGADYSEVYFTSSGTEADNLALIGAALAAPASRRRLIVSAIEHHAVLHTAHLLESLGFTVTAAPVSPDGLVSLDWLDQAITPETALVSVMHANNEIGTLQPIHEVARLAHARGALFHTDAVQTAGLLPVDVGRLECDLLTLCAHKLYGPKGAGALFIRRGVRVSPILHGGSQEREKRAGTENVAAIAGFGRAAEIALGRRAEDAACLTELRDRFIALLRGAIPGLVLNGHPTERLPGNVNVAVPGTDGATLLMSLDRHGIAASSGSACSSGSIEPSHVLKAIGLPDALASAGIRFTLGRGTTLQEVETAASVFSDIVARQRGRTQPLGAYV